MRTITPDAAKAANDAMSDHDMDMGAHMFMTDLRPANAADEKRADEIARRLCVPRSQKYKDYRVALADGFQIFLPNVPQKIYHFTNYGAAFEARYQFDPARPTSLLYKKTADGYELVGAMYTAPRRRDVRRLERTRAAQRRALAQARELLLGAEGRSVPAGGSERIRIPRKHRHAKTPANRPAATGIPQIFGWMVHVYPYETDPAKIWAH